MAKSLVFNSNLEDLSLEVVDLFFSAVREVGKERDLVFVALSGGSSLINFYENVLALANGLEDVYWKKIRFCFADERVVSLDDEDSNYRQLREIFLDELYRKFIDKSQIITSKFVYSQYETKETDKQSHMVLSHISALHKTHRKRTGLRNFWPMRRHSSTYLYPNMVQL